MPPALQAEVESEVSKGSRSLRRPRTGEAEHWLKTCQMGSLWPQKSEARTLCLWFEG